MTTAASIREVRYSRYLSRLAWRIRCSLIGLISGSHVVMVNCHFDKDNYIRLHLNQKCCLRNCNNTKIDLLGEDSQ